MELFAESASRNRADALLLSGGLDSSILASVLRPEYSVTVSYGSDSPDLLFSRAVAKKYSKKYVEVIVAAERMLELVEQLIKILKTFDPIEIRNSVVALAGIQRAKADGHSSIATGDGSDELFAGYNYLARYHTDPERLDIELRHLWKVMHFSSIKLGENVGIDVKTPFLDEEFASFAKSLGVDKKVGEYNGRKWGKFILRRCFESELGTDIAWRPKLAQEQGAATDRFQNYIAETIDDQTFANKAKTASLEEVKLRTKEHLHYYATFRSHFPPPREEQCEFRCPDCKGCLDSGARYCRTCGAYPITPSPSP